MRLGRDSEASAWGHLVNCAVGGHARVCRLDKYTLRRGQPWLRHWLHGFGKDAEITRSGLLRRVCKRDHR